MARERISRFRIERPFDGAPFATVEIVRFQTTYGVAPREPLFRVRPARRKTSFEIPLGDVAEIVAWRAAKAMADEKKKTRKRRARR